VTNASAWVVVCAAGAGKRLAGTRPKAFAALAGRPLLAESLQRLDGCDLIAGLVVAAPPGWEEATILLAEELDCDKVSAVVRGGRDRGESVSLALAEIPAEAELVLVHDAARPLVSAELVKRVLDPLEDGWDAVVPALRVSDTIKRIDKERVVETLERRSLVAVQTPQAFRAQALRAAYAAEHDEATDCAALVEARGGRVRWVEGERRLHKVTTSDDLALIESWLAKEGR
jgi:2-C-methyl-D-erythritol 4-phosphate cytidylyltransferase